MPRISIRELETRLSPKHPPDHEFVNDGQGECCICGWYDPNAEPNRHGTTIHAEFYAILSLLLLLRINEESIIDTDTLDLEVRGWNLTSVRALRKPSLF